MRLSIDIDYSYHLDERYYAAIHDAGFRYVSISHLNDEALASDDWKKDVFRTCELLAKHGLTCVQTHLPSYYILSSSEEYDAAVQERVKRSLEATKMLGARWGAYHPRTSMHYGYEKERAFKDNRAQISEFIETCEKFDVGVAIENLPVFPDCPQYQFYTSDYRDLISLVDSFGSDKIGVCWDTGHANLMPDSQAQMIRDLGKRIKIVHIHNNNKMCDEHLPPSIGTVDWEKVMPALMEADFSDSLSLEVKCSALPTIGSFYRHCYDSAVMLEKIYAEG